MSHVLKLFVAASVLLNLLLAGVIIGDVGHYFTVRARASKNITVSEVAMALPADKREHVKDAIAQADQDVKALRDKLGIAHKKAADCLKAEPFSKDAYLAQVEEIHHLKDQIRERMAQAIGMLAGQATPQERAVMVTILFP